MKIEPGTNIIVSGKRYIVNDIYILINGDGEPSVRIVCRPEMRAGRNIFGMQFIVDCIANGTIEIKNS